MSAALGAERAMQYLSVHVAATSRKCELLELTDAVQRLRIEPFARLEREHAVGVVDRVARFYAYGLVDKQAATATPLLLIAILKGHQVFAEASAALRSLLPSAAVCLRESGHNSC